MDPNADKPADNSQAPAQPTAMDVVAPPPAEKPEPQQNTEPPSDDSPEKSEPQAEVNDKPPETQKPPKKKGSGVGLAITATFIIILGLAGMATYAFLQTQ